MDKERAATAKNQEGFKSKHLPSSPEGSQMARFNKVMKKILSVPKKSLKDK